MARPFFHYILSEYADSDLDEIYDYTAGKFGIDQAIKYLLSIESVFERLCKTPEAGRRRTELKDGLRSISHEQHTIFCRINEDSIGIMRILHGSRDIIKLLPSLD